MCPGYDARMNNSGRGRSRRVLMSTLAIEHRNQSRPTIRNMAYFFGRFTLFASLDCSFLNVFWDSSLLGCSMSLLFYKRHNIMIRVHADKENTISQYSKSALKTPAQERPLLTNKTNIQKQQQQQQQQRLVTPEEHRHRSLKTATPSHTLERDVEDFPDIEYMPPRQYEQPLEEDDPIDFHAFAKLRPTFAAYFDDPIGADGKTDAQREFDKEVIPDLSPIPMTATTNTTAMKPRVAGYAAMTVSARARQRQPLQKV